MIMGDNMNCLLSLLLRTIVISDCIKYWKRVNPFDLADRDDCLLAAFGLEPDYICVKRRWFKTLSPSELYRSRGKEDGKYHYIYIQINAETGEYYIGKSNKTRWTEVERYQGSGLRFRREYSRHGEYFVRYYLAACQTAAETERLESELVDEELLRDEKCLNLVSGGGGVSRKYGDEEARRKKLRDYNKAHPERLSAMIERAKSLFQAGETPSLIERNRRIRETMSTDWYREMTRERIRKWRAEHPEEYAASRQKNRESLKSEKTKAKRNASRRQWIEANPERYAEWQEKLARARRSDETKAKRKASLKKWRDEHPDEAHERMVRMIAAGNEQRRKAVCRIDLVTGEVLETYASQHDAARWLVSVGLVKNLNCVSSVSEVCRHARCTTGYGYRQKAYGFGWRFVETTDAIDTPTVTR